MVISKDVLYNNWEYELEYKFSLPLTGCQNKFRKKQTTLARISAGYITVTSLGH